MLRILSLSFIRFYQRYVSPRKGFQCAYGFAGCGRSCSALGLRAVRRYGAFQGLSVLRRRLYLCGVAHRRFAPAAALALQTRQRAGFLQAQRGDCDLGGCDVVSDIPSLSCFVGDCGRSVNNKPKENEPQEHLPQQRTNQYFEALARAQSEADKKP